MKNNSALPPPTPWARLNLPGCDEPMDLSLRVHGNVTLHRLIFLCTESSCMAPPRSDQTSPNIPKHPQTVPDVPGHRNTFDFGCLGMFGDLWGCLGMFVGMFGLKKNNFWGIKKSKKKKKRTPKNDENRKWFLTPFFMIKILCWSRVLAQKICLYGPNSQII